jgi:phage tail-like protein
MTTYDVLEPAIALRFSVAIGGLTIERFVSCDGLTAEWEFDEFREGGQNGYATRLPRWLKHTNVRLTRPIDRHSSEIAAWFTSTQVRPMRQNATIAAYDGNWREVASWELREAWPAKYTGPQLLATSALAAVETLELSHNGFTTTVS